MIKKHYGIVTLIKECIMSFYYVFLLVYCLYYWKVLFRWNLFLETCNLIISDFSEGWAYWVGTYGFVDETYGIMIDFVFFLPYKSLIFLHLLY